MFDDLPRPLMFAHRGASLRAPENTLEAFELAARLGTDVLELDVHMTRDRKVVVFHDPTLDRTTDGSGPIAALDLAEVKQLDAGAGFRHSHGDASFRERGVRVPTLAEVVEAFPAWAFNLELKAEDPELLPEVLRILKPLGPEQVVLAAGRPEIMSILEAAKTRFPLGMSRSGILDVVARVRTFRRVPERYRGRALQIPPRRGVLPIATRGLVRAAQRSGLEVHLWTINDAKVAKQWLESGVDGIMTDDPGALASVFAEHR
ncbi:MAG: glycerophosphodiester phosphodiesterase [Myxococcota bacterium]